MPNTPRRLQSSPKQHLVAAVVYDGLCTFEFGIVVELFGLPRPEFDQWYRFVVCSAERGPVSAIGGVSVSASAGLEVLRRAQTIVLPGWRSVDEKPPHDLIEVLRAAHKRGARIVSICTGVFALAATGLLDGRRATTHWRHAELLAKRYPKIQIQPDVLYVDEGNLLTSAGSAAGIDLCLHVIRCDFGARVANTVARRLVMAPHREGGQAQFVPAPVGEAEEPWLALLLERVRRNLHEDLTVARLAKHAQMSKRTLARRFRSTTGTSPADWVLGLRITRAKDLLETSRHTIDRIALECGFGTTATLRHHFRQRVHMSPSAYRRTFGSGWGNG